MTSRLAIQPHTKSFADFRNRTTEEDKENAGKVATGAGATAAGIEGARRTAQNMASKRGGVEKLESMYQTTIQGLKKASEGTEKATSFLGKFKQKSAIYTKDLLLMLEKFKKTGVYTKSAKFINAVIDSPVTKKCAGFFGGALAFFVVVSGVSKACKNGATMAGDIKDRIDTFRTAA